MTRVLLENLEFYAYHGASAEERQIGHRFLMSLEVELTEEAGVSDRVADTIDYEQLAKAALDAATAHRFFTVERAIVEVGNKILNDFSRAHQVHIKLVKVCPPMPFTVAAAGVERTFTRP